MKTADLVIAANTIWVVVAAVLVMFMQAGFALLLVVVRPVLLARAMISSSKSKKPQARPASA